MCPLYPIQILVLYFCLVLPLLLGAVHGTGNLANWKLNFSLPSLGDDKSLREETSQSVDFLCEGCSQGENFGEVFLELKNEDPKIALVSLPQEGIEQDESGLLQVSLTGYPEDFAITLNVTGTFLGFTRVSAKATRRSRQENGAPAAMVEERSGEDDLKLTVTRSKAKKMASKIFGYSVAALISIAYINMGCALDLQVMKDVLRRPVGPAIGFLCQFLFMPVVAFALSYIFPANQPELRLGLFVTGCSPGGGASNIWTVMFGGNLDLSVTMTAISTFSAFFMMPIWIFGLGDFIIAGTDIVVPYSKILTYGIMLVVPLTIGILITRFLPSVSKFLVKIMKPMALFLILFILVCGIWSQFFMIQLISWQVAAVGFGLPWLGFAFGCLFSKLCRRQRGDIIAIAIETGVQNTGMAIFMLWFTLDHPAGDLAAVLPVAVATLTPLPLLVALVYYRLRERLCPGKPSVVEMKDLSTDGSTSATDGSTAATAEEGDAFLKKKIREEDINYNIAA